MPDAKPPDSPALDPDQDKSTLAPLRRPVFRMLWSTWLMANICMWMNDVAAAWLMTSLTTTPVWVALVQTAATLPVFLLGLPSGALADILDRRRYFLMTQIWIAGVALLLCAAIVLDLVTPPLLLALVFFNGIGLAMRWPVFSAIVPELVPRAQLPAALALNGVSMNASRIIGPLVAGALIASAGSEWVFVLNALLSLASAVIIWRWKREHVPNPLGREKLWSAMRVGVQFVGQSARLRAVFVQVFLFFFHSTACVSMLPLLARGLEEGGAGTFTLLLATMGVGAILAALALPRLRQRLSRDRLVLGGTALQSAGMLVMAFTSHLYFAVPAMFVFGVAWISTANTLSVSAQFSLPDWVRARGMSIYQMAIMGGSALGAALWGQLATLTDVHLSVGVASVTGVLLAALAQRRQQDRGIEEDMTPSRVIQRPVADAPPSSGHLMVHIEYLIDPARAADFRVLMQESRRSRLRQGALAWELLHDITEPGRFVEQIIDESWTDHLRRFDRVTGSDVALRERKLAFHRGEAPPRVTRYVLESTVSE
jgi:MFS family permease